MNNVHSKPGESLHDEIAAFNEEMRQARQSAQSGRGSLLPFVLGAFTALTTLSVTFLLLKA